MSSTKLQVRDADNTIAFMGVAGANADLACRRCYPYMESVPLPAFEDVFEAVEAGLVRYGLIPIENSQAGRVAEIHNLLPASKVHIVAEHIEPIVHHLYGASDATLDSVREVYSHNQALMQCRQFVRERGLQAHATSNTAVAAQQVAEAADASKAAICSALAGELYRLKPLAETINDAADNATLFITIAREPIDCEPEDTGMLTSLLFTLRNIPAALYKSLGGFATNGINIVRLESYIRHGTGAAQFFMTFEGNPRQRNVQLALEELGFFTQKVRVLGTYAADNKRAV